MLRFVELCGFYTIVLKSFDSLDRSYNKSHSDFLHHVSDDTVLAVYDVASNTTELASYIVADLVNVVQHE